MSLPPHGIRRRTLGDHRSALHAGTLRRRGQLQLAPRRAEVPFVRCLHLASAANEQSEMVRSPGVGSPSAVLSLSLFNQIVHIVGGPKTSSPWPRSASLRGDSHGGQNIGEAQADYTGPTAVRAGSLLTA